MSQTEKKCGVDLGLTDEEKTALLRIARAAIENTCRGNPVPSTRPSGGKLNEMRGAFVSIHKQGMLRGCIGTLEATGPLATCVEEMAKSAAFHDPRFRPVSEEELPALELEISVLTPFSELKDPADIQIGVHGLLIRKGRLSGLLLPQVASERGWDVTRFLQETCRKAGLPADAWKDKDAKISVFSADVFQETLG